MSRYWKTMAVSQAGALTLTKKLAALRKAAAQDPDILQRRDCTT